MGNLVTNGQTHAQLQNPDARNAAADVETERPPMPSGESLPMLCNYWSKTEHITLPLVAKYVHCCFKFPEWQIKNM